MASESFSFFFFPSLYYIQLRRISFSLHKQHGGKIITGRACEAYLHTSPRYHETAFFSLSFGSFFFFHGGGVYIFAC